MNINAKDFVPKMTTSFVPKMIKPSYFWKPNYNYGFLSQWYPSQFQDANGNKFANAEQYMMFGKANLFGDTAMKKVILATTDPSKIKALGRKIKNFNDDVWNEFKYKIVCDGNYLKFSQNPQLKQELLKTGNAILAEASPYDTIWGIGLDPSSAIKGMKWNGENLLGKALMEVRERLMK